MTNIYYVDGFTLGSNPCTVGGFTVTDNNGNIEQQYFVKSSSGKEITNNLTEILSVYYAALAIPTGSTIYTDSMNSISWSSGKLHKKSKRKDLRYFLYEVSQLLKSKQIKLIWVPREHNPAGFINENKDFILSAKLPEIDQDELLEKYSNNQQSLFT